MPARNKKSTRDAKLRAEQITVGQAPEPTTAAPNVIARKNLQEALIDGFENPAQWARDFLDIEPYQKQEDFLKEVRDASEANFVAGNRVGKSWTGGLLLGWKAFYRHVSPYTAPERVTPHNVYKAVSTSMTIDQAKLTWNYALTFMTNSKRFKPFLGDYVYSPFPTITLNVRNEKGDWVQSEIWARSLAKNGVYLLGHSINFLLVDECAYIRNYPIIEDEVIRMRLADTGGSIFRISTPNGRNFFFSYFQQGIAPRSGQRDPRFFSYRITTWDNPYVSRVYLEQQKERMLPEYYAQNILAEFVSLSDFFKIDAIQALYEGVEGELPTEPVRGAAYVMGVDLGAMRDPTVVMVWRADIEPAQTVFLGEIKQGSWPAARAYVKAQYEQYKPAHTVIDATGAGRPITQQLIEEDGLENVEEFIFGATSKPDVMTRLQDAVQRKRFVFAYTHATKELIAQMSFYRLDDKDLTQDYVIAAAMANKAYENFKKVNTLDTTIYDDLATIRVVRGGEVITGTDTLGPGTIFQIDPRTGLLLPGEHVDGFYL